MRFTRRRERHWYRHAEDAEPEPRRHADGGTEPAVRSTGLDTSPRPPRSLALRPNDPLGTKSPPATSSSASGGGRRNSPLPSRSRARGTSSTPSMPTSAAASGIPAMIWAGIGGCQHPANGPARRCASTARPVGWSSVEGAGGGITCQDQRRAGWAADTDLLTQTGFALSAPGSIHAVRKAPGPFVRIDIDRPASAVFVGVERLAPSWRDLAAQSRTAANSHSVEPTTAHPVPPAVAITLSPDVEVSALRVQQIRRHGAAPPGRGGGPAEARSATRQGRVMARVLRSFSGESARVPERAMGTPWSARGD